MRRTPHQRRKLSVESLEDRRLLAASLDINRDGRVSSLDALQVINALQSPVYQSELDTSGDGRVTAVDALMVINHLTSMEQDSALPSFQLQAESTPMATTTLDAAIRQRDVARLTITSITNLDLATIDTLLVDWGDERVDEFEFDDQAFPITRLHSYFIEPSTRTVQLSALLNDGSTVLLRTDSIDVLANSPAIHDRGMDGLTAVIFDSLDFTGPDLKTRIDPTIHFDFGIGTPDARLPITNDTFSIRWQGTWTPAFDGEHTFEFNVGQSDTAILYLDGQSVLDTSVQTIGTTVLTAGQPIPIEVEYAAGVGDSFISLRQETSGSFKTELPSSQLMPNIAASDLNGGLLAEQFDLNVNSIADFRASTSFANNLPSAAFNLGSSTYASVGAERASRVRGLVRPTVSGDYTFHLTASDEAELWLSAGKTSDTSKRVALVESATVKEDFADGNAGQSDPIYLVAGQEYYLEALHIHRDSLSEDHLAIGWTVPGQSQIELFPFSQSRPIVPEVTIHADISQTHEDDLFALGASFDIVRSDDLGRDLDVAYTVGGVAGNGVDFELLSGVATIPAGQRSVSVSLIPIDDALLEGTETAIIRLAADPTYQLGPESTREVILSVAGETSGGTQLLPQDFDVFVNDADSFWYAEPGNTFSQISVNDPSLPFVDGSSDPNAFEVVVDTATPSEPYRTILGHVVSKTELPNDTPMLVSVWARSANADGSDASVILRVQRDGPDFQGAQQQFDVGTQWTLLTMPVTPNFGNGNADRTVDIRFGSQEQTVQIGGFSLLTFSDPAALNDVPQPIYSYADRHWDAAWRQEAEVAAATQRTQPIEITVVDAAGNPIEGAVVTITPATNALPIAMQASPSRVVLSEDPHSQTADSARYRAIHATYFDALTDGGEAQWGPWEEDPVLPTDFLQWVIDLDLPYHGHALIWGELDSFPAPADLLSDYQDVLTAQGAAAAEAWLESEILTHVTTGPASAFAGARADGVTPKVTWWDVINHPILSRDIWDVVGDDFMLDVINAARATVHADTELIINEFDILSNPDDGQSDAFLSLLSNLDSLDPSGRAAYDAIGFQAHFVSERLPSIERILTELSEYDALGRGYHVTEYDLDTLNIDEQTQADFTRDFYLAMASHPDMELFTPWGFWAGDHWRSHEQAESFNQDWTPRPSGQWLLDQRAVNSQAFTTDDTGVTSLSVQSSSGTAGTIFVSIQLPNGRSFNSYPSISDISPYQILAPDFIVNTVADLSAESITIDGQCDGWNGKCSLREALMEVNGGSGRQAVFFDLPAEDGYLIALTERLPILTESVILDGTTQAGYRTRPLVQIDGELVSESGPGLHVQADNSIITGFAITNFNGDGIRFTGSQHSTVDKSYMGIDPAGISQSNNGSGVFLSDAASTSIRENVIASNQQHGVSVVGYLAVNNSILSNYIGVGLDGSQELGNQGHGIFIRHGGGHTIASNLVSGNGRSGIVVRGETATGIFIESNLVGVDATGMSALGNAQYGIFTRDATTTIGGYSSSSRNVVSGNGGSGVLVRGGQANVLNNFVGTSSDGQQTIGNGGHGIWIYQAVAQVGRDQETGNIISGNDAAGVVVLGNQSSGSSLRGNLIGTDQNGMLVIPNGSHGVWVRDSEFIEIGGAGFEEGNIISGNARSGIAISGGTSSNIQIKGNFVGTDSTGSDPLGNLSHGVQVFDHATQIQIGGVESSASNTIAFNGEDGVRVLRHSTGVSIRNNRIGLNNGLPIDLDLSGLSGNDAMDVDAGANHLQNSPEFLSVELTEPTLTIEFKVDSGLLYSQYDLVVDFFLGAQFGELPIYLGPVTVTEADAESTKSVVWALPISVQQGVLFAIATDADGNSSEVATLTLES